MCDVSSTNTAEGWAALAGDAAPATGHSLGWAQMAMSDDEPADLPIAVTMDAPLVPLSEINTSIELLSERTTLAQLKVPEKSICSQLAVSVIRRHRQLWHDVLALY